MIQSRLWPARRGLVRKLFMVARLHHPHIWNFPAIWRFMPPYDIGTGLAALLQCTPLEALIIRLLSHGLLPHGLRTVLQLEKEKRHWCDLKLLSDQ